MLDAFLDQSRVARGVGVYAEGVVAESAQTVDQPTVAAADVEDARARGQRRGDDHVELSPPSSVRHQMNALAIRAITAGS